MTASTRRLAESTRADDGDAPAGSATRSVRPIERERRPGRARAAREKTQDRGFRRSLTRRNRIARRASPYEPNRSAYRLPKEGKRADGERRKRLTCQANGRNASGDRRAVKRCRRAVSTQRSFERGHQSVVAAGRRALEPAWGGVRGLRGSRSASAVSGAVAPGHRCPRAR